MTQTQPVRARAIAPAALAAIALLAAALAWSYQTTLAHQVSASASNPQYSPGWLVPGLALLLLWLRRALLDLAKLRRSWWGLAFLALAGAMRLPAVWFHHEWFDPLSLLPCLLGLGLLVGGWTVLRWSWPA